MGYSSRLGQVCSLLLKAVKCVLVLSQVVKFRLRQLRFLQVLLVLAHVEPTRVKAELVGGTLLHAERGLHRAGQNCVLVDIREEGMIDDFLETICA